MERSANVFDLSFVPDDMTFDDEFRYVFVVVHRTAHAEVVHVGMKPLQT